jgi:hypothetical protein
VIRDGNALEYEANHLAPALDFVAEREKKLGIKHLTITWNHTRGRFMH